MQKCWTKYFMINFLDKLCSFEVKLTLFHAQQHIDNALQLWWDLNGRLYDQIASDDSPKLKSPMKSLSDSSSNTDQGSLPICLVINTEVLDAVPLISDLARFGVGDVGGKIRLRVMTSWRVPVGLSARTGRRAFYIIWILPDVLPGTI